MSAAAFLPLLTACSTDDLSGLWFGSSSSSQEITSASTHQVSASEKASFDRAACGLFFGNPAAQSSSQSAGATTGPISLDGSPQDNLLQAISYDMDGNYENARKLYVWLTATPPDMKVDLDCGLGVRLSGSINSLAQRRLVALDAASPEYARSEEIETVVASATVAPGPELPDPPQVERDRRFYETGGVVEAEPEDRTSPVTRMDMPVSENTAKLTRVERREAAPASAPTPASRSTATSTAPVASADVAPRLAPVAAPTPAAPAIQAEAPRSAPVVEAPTIAGDVAPTEHSGAIVASNSRPTEQGELDIVDQPPAPAPMIELPITSTQPASDAPAQEMAQSAVSAQQAAPAPTAAQSNGPYYAVQLAAYRSRGRAESAWSKFQAAPHGMLAAADHEVVSISIEGKGLFFRLLTGTFGTSAAATEACNTLKSAGTDCLVRRVTP
ncbi:SPOR domain-containing protein [Thalassospira sp.]|uniref:SPOR domain-containing protein n=1 Tax=Thalassospira sp. TaxID=1912094 RepID=UPI000C55F621|nr:SPOR domain-containing protein [Thalassospira sp.]MBC07981.1 hypothetical protein [Thalassospira sp.]|tara:strand:- start:8495 stop:9823 length:1329 start_codon:yes stop_codon:yes gene_type:complete